MKRTLSILLAVCLLLTALSACGTEPAADTTPSAEPSAAVTADAATREFTDSTGRTVTVPAEVTRVAVSGPLTQIYAIPLVGDLMVGVSNYIAEDIEKYLPDYISTLPELGQLYGGGAELDLEAILAVDPDVVIDIGDSKDGIAEDMDSLSEQTGIPFVHIDATVQTSPDAYRMLGELVGREEQAEEIATWLEDIYTMMTDMMEKVDADGAQDRALLPGRQGPERHSRGLLPRGDLQHDDGQSRRSARRRLERQRQRGGHGAAARLGPRGHNFRAGQRVRLRRLGRDLAAASGDKLRRVL